MPTNLPAAHTTTLQNIGNALALPWDLFVAAFVYYTLLTALVLGVADLAVAFVAVAYLAPVAVGAAILVARALRALARLQIDISPAPQALLR
jgi:hypothetical protein